MSKVPSVIPSTAIPKAKLRKQLHQSGVEQLSRCGIQWKFRHVEGKKCPPKTFLICGKALDRSVSMDLDHKINVGELEQESVLLDVARDAVNKFEEKDAIEPEDEERGKSISQIIGAAVDKAVRFAKTHHNVIAPRIEPWATQRKFSIDLDGFLRDRARTMHQDAEDQASRRARAIINEQARLLNVAARNGLDFVGEQDIVEKFTSGPNGQVECLTIRDSKTAKASPREGLVHESDQLTAYALASSVVDGKIPKAVGLDYVVDLKRQTKVMILASTRTQDQLDIYLERLANAVATIESGMFVPAPQTAWWCSEKMCGYHSICPYFRGARKTTTFGKELKGSAGKLVTISAQEVE